MKYLIFTCDVTRGKVQICEVKCLYFLYKYEDTKFFISEILHQVSKIISDLKYVNRIVTKLGRTLDATVPKYGKWTKFTNF